jgi:hypothetical protein
MAKRIAALFDIDGTLIITGGEARRTGIDLTAALRLGVIPTHGGLAALAR